MIRTDVLVVGGGPAGTTCAWKLRKLGIDVLLIEKASYPRNKPCAGWISPEVLEDLEIQTGEYPYPLTVLNEIDVSIRGLRFRVKTRVFTIRRTEFDAWLAERSGVPIHQHEVHSIVQTDGGYLVDGIYFCHYLVGAGGTFCPVARTFFRSLKPPEARSRIVTLEEEFLTGNSMQTTIQIDKVSQQSRDRSCHLWFFQDGFPGYAWYVPKEGGWLNVGLGGASEKLKQRGVSIHRYWERLIQHLEALHLIGEEEFHPQGYVYYLRGRKPILQQGSAFIIGDAAGLATSDMGEGIGPAVRSGLIAAEAIATQRPIDYRRIRRWSEPWPFGWLLGRSYR